MEKLCAREREDEKSRRRSRSATIFKNLLISNATKTTKNTQQECACWCVCVCVSEGATGREGLWGCTVHSACQLFAFPSTVGCRTQNFECESEKSIQSECVCVCECVWCVCECVCVFDGNELVSDMTKLRTKPKQSVLSKICLDVYRPIRRRHSCTCAAYSNYIYISIYISNLYQAKRLNKVLIFAAFKTKVKSRI